MITDSQIKRWGDDHTNMRDGFGFLDERARVLDWIEYELRQARRGSKDAQLLTRLRNEIESGKDAPQGRLV